MAVPVAVAALIALAIGFVIGVPLTPESSSAGGTARSPRPGSPCRRCCSTWCLWHRSGMVVVDRMRDVVFINDRATGAAWCAAVCSTSGRGRSPNTLDTGEDTEVDLSPLRRASTGRSGVSVRGHVRLLTTDDPDSPSSISTTSRSLLGWRPAGAISSPTSVTS